MVASTARNGRADRHLANGNGHAHGTAREPDAPLDPVSDGADGRGPDGRFGKGNRCAAGNPFARRMARLRSALLDAVSEEDLLAVARKLVEQAKAGDTAAAKLLLAYAVGKPAKAADPDRLDAEEWRLCQEWPEHADAWAALRRMPFEEALRALKAMPPIIVPLFDDPVAEAE